MIIYRLKLLPEIIALINNETDSLYSYNTHEDCEHTSTLSRNHSKLDMTDKE